PRRGRAAGGVGAPRLAGGGSAPVPAGASRRFRPVRRRALAQVLSPARGRHEPGAGDRPGPHGTRSECADRVGVGSDRAAAAARRPEPYSALDQRSVYQTKRNLTGKVLRQLRSTKLEGRPAELAQQLLARENDLYASFEPLLRGRLTAQRGRIHGEYHLGNVLWTGKDFAVVDFGQNPNKPLPERRRKRSGLRDIASMLRSFDLAATMALRDTATVRESG